MARPIEPLKEYDVDIRTSDGLVLCSARVRNCRSPIAARAVVLAGLTTDIREVGKVGTNVTYKKETK